MKKVGAVIVLILIIAAGVYLLSRKPNDDSKAVQSTDTNQSQNNNQEKKMSDLNFPGVLDKVRIENKKAVIKTNKGTIEIELSADIAPKSVSNFVYLSELGFYNNLTWHRVVPGFVIQGGDPDGNGTGGPGYKWDDEPVVGDYKAGTVAMANAGPNTNGSQFFICLEDQPSLPKSYNLFGQVTVGMDVVKQIAVDDKIESITITDK